ncbi:MAG: hypothetical protein KDE27_18555 [Planctomycetes bacterium]|nr:hypothetical protein [Planctomycetota bacterium]
MNRRFDVAVFGPLIVAILIVGLRESTRASIVPEPPPGTAVALPMVRGHATPKRALAYDVDGERSGLRFLVRRGSAEQLFRCDGVRGSLVLGETGDARLQLDFDLGALRAVGDPSAPAAGFDLWDVLGTSSDAEVRYEASLVSTASTPLPCLTQKVWVGTLRFGGRIVRQPMVLWQTALPGQPLRLQGHGPVRADAYGLLRHTLPTPLREPYEVFLGLDLAWTRRKHG